MHDRLLAEFEGMQPKLLIAGDVLRMGLEDGNPPVLERAELEEALCHPLKGTWLTGRVTQHHRDIPRETVVDDTFPMRSQMMQNLRSQCKE